MNRRVIATMTLLLGLTGCSPSEPEPTTTTPAYRLVSEQDRQIVVQVDAMPPSGGLRAVFDDVRTGKQRPDGGYFVRINCATGAAAAADNRLANGKFAVGQLGAAQTGLAAGGAEFAEVPDRACPA